MYSLFDDNADFARTQGSRDKKKRKRGLGFYAGAGAGLAAAGGAGYRYGGAALDYRGAQKRLANDYGDGRDSSKWGAASADNRKVRGGGAKGQLSRDLEAVKSAGSRSGSYVQNNYNKPGKVWGDISNTASREARQGVMGAKVLGNRLGTAGKVGTGLAAAGILGGAAYGATRQKRKKSMLDRLLSR